LAVLRDSHCIDMELPKRPWKVTTKTVAEPSWPQARIVTLHN